MNMAVVCGVTGAWVASVCPAQGPDTETLAGRVVTDSARVVEGEVVLIRGHARDQQLLEDFAIKVRAAGAFPILSYTSDHLLRGMADQVPERYDNQLNAMDIKLAPSLNVVISVESAESPSLLNDIAPARLATRAKADGAYAELLRKLGVRQVTVGNGLYPTAALANQYALSVDELTRIYNRALDAEPGGLHATGEMVRYVLASGKEAHITNPNGTDLKFRVEGRPVWIADGLPPPEPQRGEGRRAGFAAIALPAGEAMLVPVQNSAEGKVVVDTLTSRGREITGLTLAIKGGKVQNMYARSGIDALRPLYEAAGPGKEQVSYIDIGVNPAVVLPAGVKASAAIAMGMVSVGIGNNWRAGGENGAAFELLLSLPGSTLTVDEAVLVESGKLIMPVSKDVGEAAEAPQTTPEEGK